MSSWELLYSECALSTGGLSHKKVYLVTSLIFQGIILESIPNLWHAYQRIVHTASGFNISFSCERSCETSLSNVTDSPTLLTIARRNDMSRTCKDQ